MSQPALPQGYLQNGYFDNKGNPLAEVIIDWPRQIAQNLDQAGMSTSQLRGRFFAEVRRLENKLQAAKDYDALRPEVLKLVVLANDATKEGKDKAPPLFKQFIEANVRQAARGEKEFRAFVNHFECVVGFFPARRGR